MTLPTGGMKTPGEAIAAYEAAKAHIKASRPWYRKKRWWTPGVLMLVALATTAENGDEGKQGIELAGRSQESPATSVSSPGPTPTAAAGVGYARPARTATPSSGKEDQSAKTDSSTAASTSRSASTTPRPKASPPASSKTSLPKASPTFRGKNKSDSGKAKMTSGQKNALRAGQSYIDIMSFSKAGLIHQLSSSFGDAYSNSDATFAASHVDADWNAEAVEAAESYLEIMPMSETALIQQLSSAAGDQFTKAQARYAAHKVL